MLDGQCTDPAGQVVATAVLEVLAPTTRQHSKWRSTVLKDLWSAAGLKPMLTGVVHPCSTDALAGAVEAAEAGLILPVLFGPEAEIRRVADQAHIDIGKCRIVTTTDPKIRRSKAVRPLGR